MKYVLIAMIALSMFLIIFNPSTTVSSSSSELTLIAIKEYKLPTPRQIMFSNGMIGFRAGDLPYINTPGEPVIPYVPILVVVPPWAGRIYVEVETIGLEKIVFNKPLLANPDPIPSVGEVRIRLKPFHGQYPYPANLYDNIGIYWWGSIRIGLLHVYPYKLVDNHTLTYPGRIIIRIYANRVERYERHHIQRMLAHIAVKTLLKEAINPEALIKWYPKEYKCYLDPYGVRGPDYAILTPRDWVDTVKSLALLRAGMGYNTTIFTVEYVDEKYNGSNLVEKIRSFARDLREQGYTYLLLAGDTNVIPTAYFYMEDTAWGWEDAYKATDQYYSLLDGNWDPNGNGKKLEAIDTDGDEIPDTIVEELPDQFPDLYVGRLPASNEDELKDLINTIIAYEEQPSSGNWIYHAGLGAAIAYYENEDGWVPVKLDGARLTHAITINLLDPAGYNYTRAYEDEGDDPSSYPHELPLNTDTVSAMINNGNALLVFSAHGSPTGLWRKIWYDDDNDGVPESNEMYWTIFLDTSISYNPNGMRGFYYAVACLSGWYDGSEDSLAEHMLKTATMASIASSRIAYLEWYWEPGGYYAEEYAYLFAEAVINGSSAGDSFYYSKIQYVLEHAGLYTESYVEVKVFLEFNLLGEPLIRSPFNHSSSKPLVYYDMIKTGMNTIHVETPDGEPAYNAVVSVVDPGTCDIIDSSLTDASGNALITIPDTYGLHVVRIYVTYKNYAVYYSEEIVQPVNDTTPPSIQILEPSKEYYNTTRIRIIYKIIDESPLTQIGYRITRGSELIYENNTGPTCNATIELPNDGNYTLTVYAIDEAGNEANITKWFIIDTTPPIITIKWIYPGNITSSRIVFLEWDSWDENGIITHRIYVDDMLIVETKEHYVILELSEGEHIVKIVAFDKAGNPGYCVETIIIDYTPPSLTILSPSNNTITNRSEIEVTWRSWDRLATRYRVYRNGVLIAETSMENISVELEEGVNNIVIEAIDEASNTKKALLRVIRDTDTPQLVIDLPLESRNTSIYSTYRVYDEVGIKEISVEILETGERIILNKTEGSLELRLPGEGIYTLRFIAVDNAGNKAVYERKVVIDTTPPTLVVMGITNNTWSREPSFIAVAEDNYLMKHIRIYINDSLYKEMNSSGLKASIYVPLLHLNDGVYKITVIAEDDVGNKRSLTLILGVDKTKPRITLLKPINNTIINTSTLELEWTINEPLTQLILHIDGVAEKLKPNSTSIIVKGLSDGYHTIVIKAIDRGGNTASYKLRILVDTTPPIITIKQINIDTKNGIVTIQFNISEETLWIKAHLLKPDGTRINLQVTDNNLEFSIEPGTYHIVIECSDKANNTYKREIVITIPGENKLLTYHMFILATVITAAILAYVVISKLIRR